MRKGPAGSLLLTGLVLCGLQAAAEDPAPANDDCLACHADASLTREDGRPLQAGLDRFEASIHGQAGLACVDCHADLAHVTDFPHVEKLAPARCDACHSDEAEKLAASAHAGSEGRPGARCADCHGTHDILPSSDRASRTYHFRVPETCGGCHGNPQRIREQGLPGGNVEAQFEDSIHGQALSRSGLKVAPNCATCHGAHDVRKPGDPESRVNRSRTAATCGSCHEGIRNRYEASVHGEAMLAGNQAAAVCSDCHSAHGIRATGVPAWKLGVIRECGTCHEQSLRTYRDGFHGQATAIGFTRVAACADCHGSHDILPPHDPRSRVAMPNRLRTCGKCHPDANANFVQFDPHADPGDPDRNRPVYYTALFMKALLWCVFAFFGIHTALWFPRELAFRRRTRAPDAATAETEPAPRDPGQKGGHDDEA